MLICGYKLLTYTNSTIHSAFGNRNRCKLVSYIFTICVFMFIYVHTRYGIYIISSISFFKRYVLHIWNNSNDVDILNTNYV